MYVSYPNHIVGPDAEYHGRVYGLYRSCMMTACTSRDSKLITVVGATKDAWNIDKMGGLGLLRELEQGQTRR